MSHLEAVYGLQVRHATFTYLSSHIRVLSFLYYNQSQRLKSTNSENLELSSTCSRQRKAPKFSYPDSFTGVSVSEQCFTSPPTQYRLYGRRFLQVKRPNQQYQSTEGRSTKDKENNENNYKCTYKLT